MFSSSLTIDCCVIWYDNSYTSSLHTASGISNTFSENIRVFVISGKCCGDDVVLEILALLLGLMTWYRTAVKLRDKLIVSLVCWLATIMKNLVLLHQSDRTVLLQWAEDMYNLWYGLRYSFWNWAIWNIGADHRFLIYQLRHRTIQETHWTGKYLRTVFQRRSE